jgi:tyrosyl-tRNA synthetase
MEEETKIQELLNKGVETVNIKEDLEKKLRSKKKLRIKFGIDPTGFELTLGHSVVLRKLKQFQDLGHQIVLLFGNFTAQIGDPTDKNAIRKVLTREEVEKNAEDYLSQAGKIIDTKKVELVWNNDWLQKLNFADVLKLAGNYTVSQMLERDMFQKRISENKSINLVEFMYPLMQGYDSVAIKADVELGGTDQLFNMMCGRTLQKAYNQTPQDVLACPLLVGLDGSEKMSKSLNNYIAINDTAKEMYGKTMSIPDKVIFTYFELLTDVSLEDLKILKQEMKQGKNPRDIKMQLAREIVSFYYDKDEAKKAEEQFLKVFQKNDLPDDIPEITFDKKNMQVWELVNISKLCASNSEAKRMIIQGSVKIDNKKYTDPYLNIDLKKEQVLKVGKRKFLKIIT